MNTLRVGGVNQQGYSYVDDSTLLPAAPTLTGGLVNNLNWIWDPNALMAVKATGSTAGGSSVNVVNVVSVSVASLPLPSGAATEATLAKIPGLAIPMYDYVSLAQNATQDIYSFKSGGSGGTLVATVTITYTDSTKATLSTVAKT